MQLMMKMWEDLKKRPDECKRVMEELHREVEKMVREREERSKKAEERNRKLIEEQNKFWEEYDRKAEKRNRKILEELVREREELARETDKLVREREERSKKAEEQKRIAEEQKRIAEEQNRKLAEELNRRECEERVLKVQPHHQVDARVTAEDKSEGMTNQIHEEVKTAEGKTVEVQIEAEEDVCKVEVETEELKQIMEEEVEMKTEEMERIIEEEIEENIQGCEEKVLIQDEFEQEEVGKMSPSVKNGVTPVMPPKSLKYSEDGKENPDAVMRAAEQHLALINTVEGHRIQFSYPTLEGNARTWTGIFNVFPKFLKKFNDKIFVRDWSEETRTNVKINLRNNHHNHVMESISEYTTKNIMRPKISFIPRNYQAIICVVTRQLSITTQNLLGKASHAELGRYQKAVVEYDCTFAGTPKKKIEILNAQQREQRSQLLTENKQEPPKTKEKIYQALVKSGKEKKEKPKKKTYQFSEGQSVRLRVPRVSNPNLKLYPKFFLLYEGPYFIDKVTDKMWPDC